MLQVYRHDTRKSAISERPYQLGFAQGFRSIGRRVLRPEPLIMKFPKIFLKFPKIFLLFIVHNYGYSITSTKIDRWLSI
jgi:hypothetical protein